ncbi:hypothetical protein RV11_GL002911 [Enterococcus phoeniculicola]|jgi:uncharacterized membrane protein|uniref:Integral membrane protein n=1 Tax=Enterococcus phoeniculicola ATCC BAA-412 TaxID=1158610 RepID=R3TM76_9ENTE|nr:QueT transporter family protein [Enterococcus phoeniculicola]EOL42589.1 hypothetical protein UC3_02942 [Enterococcus phoeniculicola ATCC BAA-412]EOT79127.1 integral membrane protein [Enterococcus phoeniculicola ATCC BAA-412]OJG72329.1 hypothetical protein RV11_GL002911 [Enterococcus phoeniculicola]
METNSRKQLRLVVLNGVVMALYLALSIIFQPVSSGPIQFRISESLNHLVVFNRKLMWGVVGAVIVYNTFWGYGVMDALFGGTQTFLSLGLTALLYHRVKNVKLRLVINTLAFTVSMALIAWMINMTGGGAFWGTYGTLALSEFIIMTLSAPLMYYLNSRLHFEKRA